MFKLRPLVPLLLLALALPLAADELPAAERKQRERVAALWLKLGKRALKAKLRELFELDKSDLDFGIYRIMAAKNKEVTDFLDRQLKDVVKQTLTEHGAGATDALQAELDEMIAGLRKAKLSDEQIEASDGVKDLREKLAAAGGKTGEELEADIYNHLLAFFSRYYDEGDFISQRRYKGDTYAIPYSGEEVTLHWANKDQYYIKSGEWHKDYRFKLPDGRRVRFALVDATQETGNNKEPDEAKRREQVAAEKAAERVLCSVRALVLGAGAAGGGAGGGAGSTTRGGGGAAEYRGGGAITGGGMGA